jgi:hypothetical protein
MKEVYEIADKFDEMLEQLEKAGTPPTYNGILADLYLKKSKVKAKGYLSLAKIIETFFGNDYTEIMWGVARKKLKAIADTAKVWVKLPNGDMVYVKRFIKFKDRVVSHERELQRIKDDPQEAIRFLHESNLYTLEQLEQIRNDTNSALLRRAIERGIISGDYVKHHGQLVKVNPTAPELPVPLTLADIAQRLSFPSPKELSDGN